MRSVGPTLKIWLFHWLCGYWQQQHTNNNFINLDLYWLLILYSTFPEDKDYSWLFLSAFLKNHKSKSNYPFFFAILQMWEAKRVDKKAIKHLNATKQNVLNTLSCLQNTWLRKCPTFIDLVWKYQPDVLNSSKKHWNLLVSSIKHYSWIKWKGFSFCSKILLFSLVSLKNQIEDRLTKNGKSIKIAVIIFILTFYIQIIYFFSFSIFFLV